MYSLLEGLPVKIVSIPKTAKYIPKLSLHSCKNRIIRHKRQKRNLNPKSFHISPSLFENATRNNYSKNYCNVKRCTNFVSLKVIKAGGTHTCGRYHKLLCN
jgi:hypothetical protein